MYSCNCAERLAMRKHQLGRWLAPPQTLASPASSLQRPVAAQGRRRRRTSRCSRRELSPQRRMGTSRRRRRRRRGRLCWREKIWRCCCGRTRRIQCHRQSSCEGRHPSRPERIPRRDPPMPAPHQRHPEAALVRASGRAAAAWLPRLVGRRARRAPRGPEQPDRALSVNQKAHLPPCLSSRGLSKRGPGSRKTAAHPRPVIRKTACFRSRTRCSASLHPEARRPAASNLPHLWRLRVPH
ncbi:hypothetical protein F751_5670 [Auxenochlorella protothecoides]|uniref:Uncharacterized protein n=1 Tax=Auxenochlorella protothecoides TaxID=3075 RepID=A0A087SPQ2_AUXPR|nr:hypothetical protein F751_5670 [Auxenochlorella protothecoides]KFM27706.1 hypothetical protein F751_5670 [Auxenochlorella protothecoides]